MRTVEEGPSFFLSQCFEKLPFSALDDAPCWRDRLKPLEEPVKSFLFAQWQALEDDYTSALAKVTKESMVRAKSLTAGQLETGDLPFVR